MGLIKRRKYMGFTYYKSPFSVNASRKVASIYLVRHIALLLQN